MKIAAAIATLCLTGAFLSPDSHRLRAISSVAKISPTPALAATASKATATRTRPTACRNWAARKRHTSPSRCADTATARVSTRPWSRRHQSLTDQDIEDLSAYFASFENETIAAGGSEGTAIEAAATCVACHGQNGIGLSPTWPTLAGQHEDYLVNSLKQYRDGTRGDPVMMPMAANAVRPGHQAARALLRRPGWDWKPPLKKN